MNLHILSPMNGKVVVFPVLCVDVKLLAPEQLDRIYLYLIFKNMSYVSVQ
jgi:hypothetical protein